jgi:hypothetical protein
VIIKKGDGFARLITNANIICNVFKTKDVATLALGSRPRRKLAKVWAKNEAWESYFMLPGVWESVRE